MKKNYEELDLTILRLDSDIVTTSTPRFPDDVGQFDQDWLEGVLLD